MKTVQYFVMFLTCLLLLYSCSKDAESEAPSCPQTENISMRINGEEKQFEIQGWGISLDNDGTGHTLELLIVSGVYYPSQDSYAISIELPYKKTGDNLIEEFNYFRVKDTTSARGDFDPGNLQSSVNINSNTCISLSFSGTAIIDGKKIIISEGVIEHVYRDAF